MSNERILPYNLSKELTTDELEGISASGTSVATANATYSPQGGTDVNADVNIDL
ncbi:MAG: hypothetical protein WAW86_06400 [Gammaproteobacteria bacterium]